jgi:hypothetical protein
MVWEPGISLLFLFICYDFTTELQQLLGPYSQHFIFFVTYKLAQLAMVFNYSRLEMRAREKYTSLISY